MSLFFKLEMEIQSNPYGSHGLCQRLKTVILNFIPKPWAPKDYQV